MNKEWKSDPICVEELRFKRKLGFWKKLRGWWRAKWGFCPECNNDAPELDSCRVCGGYSVASGGEYPHPKEAQERWWKRFTGQLPLLPPRCLHGNSMDEFCYQCHQMMVGRDPQNPRRG